MILRRAVLWASYATNVAPAQPEATPVPRPYRAPFPSTSQDRHLGLSRKVPPPSAFFDVAEPHGSPASPVPSHSDHSLAV